MEELHLFRTPAGYQASIRLERDGTWSLIVDRFFEGEPWSLEDREWYYNLSLREAADCLTEELFGVRTRNS